ncbi:hypothetical protein MTR_7g031710 [Medicago truncatula]|uniref:Uncharacterized protein n=1 Tax=Medicago truncatula TaxID=3880 RepID=G7L4B2_MEDTR|nr:hypothetical protein MTR_7g031710 [Medicago truncatula]
MDDVPYPLRILHRYLSDTFRYVLGEIRLCGLIRKNTLESLDGVGIELAELSLDEPDLEADLYLDDGNEGEKIETINVN